MEENQEMDIAQLRALAILNLDALGEDVPQELSLRAQAYGLHQTQGVPKLS